MDVAAYIFIAPPNLEELERRLRGRGTETEEKINKRLKGAIHEIEHSKDLSWDAYIINDDVQVAYTKLRDILKQSRDECTIARTKSLTHQ